MKFERVAWLTLAQAIHSFGSSVSRKLCRRGGPAGLLVLLRWTLTQEVFAAERGVHAV